MRTNPDPTKFYMSVAQGVKDGSDLTGPDVEVPFCHAHQRWPCAECGSAHFKGCDCPVCDPQPKDELGEVREAAGYAASMLRGMERHWRKARETKIADDIDRYSTLLRKFSNGEL